MLHIKRFIDKVSMMETRQGKDVVIPISEARILRDELSKLIIDNYELSQNKVVAEPVFQIELNGGRF
tara:strand:+ start:55 stop:255 length:201 start_codon:yes stop_codon:yes gene_type:complete